MTMTNDQLPPTPKRTIRGDIDAAASKLPPIDFSMDEHDDSTLERGKHSLYGWSPAMVIAGIFVGSFIFGVLFTSSILAGYIEIQPAEIKGFLKSLIPK